MIVLIPSVDLFLILCREAWDGVSSSWWVFLGEERDVDRHTGKKPKNTKTKTKKQKTTFLMVCGEFWWELWTWALPQDLGIFLKAIYLLAL